MPIQLSGDVLLATAATAPTLDLQQQSVVSYSCWMRMDQSQGGLNPDQQKVMSWGSSNNSGYYNHYLNLSSGGIDAHAYVHETVGGGYHYNDAEVQVGGPIPAGQTSHVGLVLNAGTATLFVNGLQVWTQNLVNWTGSILPLQGDQTDGNDPLNAFQLSSYDHGTGQPGLTVTLQDAAVWVGYALTKNDCLALRDRTSTPAQIGIVNNVSKLAWWVSLDGTAGQTAAVHDAALADKSNNNRFPIASITLNNGALAPTYTSGPLIYTAPAKVSSALVTPGRNGILINFSTNVPNGSSTNVQQIIANPTLTSAGVNGGQSVTLGDPNWTTPLPGTMGVGTSTNAYTVTGDVNAKFLTNVKPQDSLIFASNPNNVYQVYTVDSDTQLTLASDYAGPASSSTTALRRNTWGPIWGVTYTGDPSTPLPWVYYGLRDPIPAADTPTLMASDPWVFTEAGSVASVTRTNLVVDNSTKTTLLPAFVPSPKTMPIGHNLNTPETYYSNMMWFSNVARRLPGWGSADFDATTGYPKTSATGIDSNYISLLTFCDDSSCIDGTGTGAGTPNGPTNGVWTFQWNGPGRDPANPTNPIFSLANSNNQTGCSITQYGTPTLQPVPNPPTANPDPNFANTLQFKVTQDVTQGFNTPDLYLRVACNPFPVAFSSLRIYPPDPSDTTGTKSLTDASPKFHPSFLGMLSGAKVIRFMQAIDHVTQAGVYTGGGGSINDWSDFRDPNSLLFNVATRSIGGPITRIDPYTDTENYFALSASFQVTFAAPHGCKEGNFIGLSSISNPAPASQGAFPLVLMGTVSVSPNSPTVNGVGTVFKSALKIQDAYNTASILLFQGDNSHTPYTVTDIASDTSCTITPAYSGTAITNGQVTLLKAISGTVSVVVDTTNVSGANTSFASQVNAGDQLVFSADTTKTPYPVASVVDNTDLVLAANYTGPLTAGQSANVIKTITGTVSVTSGTPNVVGSNTSFTSALVGANVIFGGNANVVYTVASVTSGTSLTLTSNYGGSTGSGVSMGTVTALSGTVSVVKKTSAVSGSGTDFNSLHVGDVLYFAQDTSNTPYTVASIADPNNLTLSVNYTGTATISGSAANVNYNLLLPSPAGGLPAMVHVNSPTTAVVSPIGDLGKMTIAAPVTMPTGAGWTGPGTVNPGISPQDCVDLCNLVGADFWISLPYAITDAAVTSLLQTIGPLLNPGLKFYVEYSNECWNWLYPGCYWCESNATLNNQSTDRYWYYAKRTGQVHALAASALGSRASDLVRVYGAQGADPGGSTQNIVNWAKGFDYPVDVLATAPYIDNSPAGWNDGQYEPSLRPAFDACNVDQIMDLGELYMMYGGWAKRYIADHVPYLTAKYPNASMVTYEGGPQLGTPNAANTSWTTTGANVVRNKIWAHHPRMRGIMLWFLQSLQDAGCNLLTKYELCGDQEDTTSNWFTYYYYNQPAGMGDGSDGLPDNSKANLATGINYLKSSSQNPYGSPTLVSVVGGAINYWNSLVRPNSLNNLPLNSKPLGSA